MDKRIKAVVNLLATVMGNTAAIGFGIGLYEGKTAYVLMASAVLIVACCMAWEGKNNAGIHFLARANLFINLLWRLRFSRRPPRNKQENRAFPAKWSERRV